MPWLSKEERLNRRYPVTENMQVQHAEWVIERFGTVLLLTVVLLALLGVFSNGLLSSAVAISPSGRLQVEYQRFLRNGANSRMTLQVESSANGEVQINLAGNALEGLILESIQPQPVATSSYQGNGLTLRVLTDAKGTARVHLLQRSDGIGLYQWVVSSAGESLTFNHFIYP